MPYEIEYKLGGGDPHSYRLEVRKASNASWRVARFDDCGDAVEALVGFFKILDEADKGPHMELKVVWVD